jgi:hypothetical protein
VACPQGGWPAAVFYLFGHPTPYACDYPESKAEKEAEEKVKTIQSFVYQFQDHFTVSKFLLLYFLPLGDL